MRGWVLDCYPDHERNEMVLWLKTNTGAIKIVDPDFAPKMYVHSTRDRLRKLIKDLELIGVHDTAMEKHRIALGGEEKEVLAITAREYSSLVPMAMTIDSWGSYRDHSLFNVDLRFDQRYLMHRGLFSMALVDVETLRCMDSRLRIDYPIPDMKGVKLTVDLEGKGIPTFDDELRAIHVDDITLDGDEPTMLGDLSSLIKKLDPDVIYTTKGDSFYIPYLTKRAEANGMKLELGRDPGDRTTKGKSYFTYGRIKYKPPGYKLRGRVHIDSESSFIFAESGIYGLVELSRLSMIPIQDLSRLSPGSAISAMQVNEALRSGTLIQWKKNLPEGFKTAGALIVTDRGGFIYEPKVGVHDNVFEVDFLSLYPNIMVHFNISPETVMCRCCPRSSTIVPEIGYWICEQHEGMLKKVLRPIVDRRIAFKQMVRDGNRKKEMYSQRAKALKWILVTCFGYTGYKNARFGRIECHESITAYGRDILLRTSSIAESFGLEVLHGIVDSLWLKGNADPNMFCEQVTKEIGIRLMLEGRYRWIVFLPNVTTGVGALNRYYGLFENGEIKVRGIALRRGDTPIIVEEMQTEMLAQLSRAKDAPSFLDIVPSTLDVVDRYVRLLRDGSVPLEKLILKKSVSKRLEEYTQFNDSVAALNRLRSEGFEVQPGESVEFVVCDSSSKRSGDRVKIAQFLDGTEQYDAEKYVDLALRGASELLSPFGWSFEEMRQRW